MLELKKGTILIRNKFFGLVAVAMSGPEELIGFTEELCARSDKSQFSFGQFGGGGSNTWLGQLGAHCTMSFRCRGAANRSNSPKVRRMSESGGIIPLKKRSWGKINWKTKGKDKG